MTTTTTTFKTLVSDAREIAYGTWFIMQEAFTRETNDAIKDRLNTARARLFRIYSDIHDEERVNADDNRLMIASNAIWSMISTIDLMTQDKVRAFDGEGIFKGQETILYALTRMSK